jgi:hypothetical protein
LTAFTGDAPLGVVDDADVAPIAFLHSSLLACGYNVADDDEVDAILFGDSTAEAVATLQACCNLPDTGIVDSATWAALVGETLIAGGDGNRDDAARHAALSSLVAVFDNSPTSGGREKTWASAVATALSSAVSPWASWLIVGWSAPHIVRSVTSLSRNGPNTCAASCSFVSAGGCGAGRLAGWTLPFGEAAIACRWLARRCLEVSWGEGRRNGFCLGG